MRRSKLRWSQATLALLALGLQACANLPLATLSAPSNPAQAPSGTTPAQGGGGGTAPVALAPQLAPALPPVGELSLPTQAGAPSASPADQSALDWLTRLDGELEAAEQAAIAPGAAPAYALAQATNPTAPPLGPDGKPLNPPLGPDGKPLNPPVGPDGKPLNPPVGPDGKPLNPPLGPDGKPLNPPLGADGRPSNPPLGPDGKPLNPPLAGGLPQVGQDAAASRAGQPGPAPQGQAVGLRREALSGAFARAKREERQDGDRRVRVVETELEAGQAGDALRRRWSLELSLGADGQSVVAATQRYRAEGEDGRVVEAIRTRRNEADGSQSLEIVGKLSLPQLGEGGQAAAFAFTIRKQVAPDGSVAGEAELAGVGRKPLTLKVGGKVAPPPAKLPPAPVLTLPKPGELLARLGEPKPAETEGERRSFSGCSREDFLIGLSGKASTSAILSLSVPDDTLLIEGAGVVEITAQAAATHTLHLGQGAGCSFVAAYDGARTSDPSTGGTRAAGAIAAIPTFAADGQSAKVRIDCSKLPTGVTHWLRFTTRLADGSYEVAEGVFSVHARP